jgi:hypothetical protein
MCGKCSLVEIAAACVPLPAPGGPRRTMYLDTLTFLPYEQRVVITMEFEVSIDTKERVTDNTNDNQQSRRRSQ